MNPDPGGRHPPPLAQTNDAQWHIWQNRSIKHLPLDERTSWYWGDAPVTEQLMLFGFELQTL